MQFGHQKIDARRDLAVGSMSHHDNWGRLLNNQAMEGPLPTCLGRLWASDDALQSVDFATVDPIVGLEPPLAAGCRVGHILQAPSLARLGKRLLLGPGPQLGLVKQSCNPSFVLDAPPAMPTGAFLSINKSFVVCPPECEGVHAREPEPAPRDVNLFWRQVASVATKSRLFDPFLRVLVERLPTANVRLNWTRHIAIDDEVP
mmetsp:Transcript_29426/g.94331  ORF Transcript_29426/g.94331 Transcript_29426/m.94331 type:complete len:202 (-) Transcript_29426:17-622(-)